MAILYVTDGAWGTGLSRLLTAAEIDGNFYDLDFRVLDLETNAPQPKELENITLVGTQLTFFMQGGATFGPFTIPVATFHFRGEWATGTGYIELDLITSPSGLGGLWLVLQDHDTTGVASFDPAAENTAGPLYEQLVPSIAEITTRPYDVAFKIGSTSPAAGEVIGIIPVPTTRPLLFAADFAGAVGYVDTAPGADYPIDVKDDGVSIGTVTVHSNGTTTFTTVSNTSKNVAGGSILTFVAPDQGTAQDASIANGVWTLPGELTF